MSGIDSRTIEVDGLVVRAGGSVLLGPVTARFEAARLTAVLGPNGAGKSTLLAALSQWRRPDAGQVRFGGRDLHTIPADTLARQRAVVAQETSVAFDYSVRELLELGRLPHRPSAADEAIVAAALHEHELLAFADRGVASLSGGERARVHLARACVQIAPSPAAEGGAAALRSRWLLLDEPTAALDLAHQHTTLARVRERAAAGCGVVIVLHDLNLALRHADHALVLERGRVAAAGPVREVLSPELVGRVFGVRCEAVTGGDRVPQLLMAA
jgi:iron complex transport system ATP-binding protein